MADLGAIEEDVPFDAGTADTLISACRAAASAITGQTGSRASWVSTAMTDFRGRFSELFADNAATAAGDAIELANRLREVATGAERLKEEAAKEQQRREKARAWKKEHDDRNVFEQGWDWATGGDDPPVGPPAEPVSVAVSPAVNGARETPAQGGASGGGGGTSSARPSQLQTFATGSQGANDTLRPRPAALRAAYASFQARCRWGTLSASGVFSGFDQWLAANDDDVTWATAVAAAFTAAGGDGEVSTLSDSAVAAALQAAGVNATRQDLTIDPVQAQGHPPTTGYANDPVNTATGNFVETETDLVFPGANATLVLSRTYNSFRSAEPGSSTAGAFGPGWSSVCEAGLTLDPERARLVLPDGRQIFFPRLGDGWDRAQGESLWLARDDADGSTDLLVTGNEGSWWRLDAGGALRSFGHGPLSSRTSVEVIRDAAGRVARLTHARGQWVELDRSGDAERVTAARSADGRTVTYAYDDEGRLVSATGPTGTRTYRWDENGLVAAVVDADGVVEVENVYDAQGRVTRQRSPFGRVTRFAYLPARVTVVSDEDGTRSNTWIHDERGRLVGVVDAEDHRQSTSYDRWGNPVLLTERDGATTVHEYDARGRRVRTVTPAGADLTYGYDALDRVITVVTEQGAVTEYTYDGELRNPSTIVDPEGGLTRLTWTDGLLTQIVDPTDVVVHLSYDAHGDLVGTTDADGATARLERDDLGRVTAAITPSGHRTTYVWDPTSGLLAGRVDPDGAIWRYERSTAGRLLATVDPLGGRISVERGRHGEETATVDALGRRLDRELDALGNLASVVLPDGSRWEFAHDALSRRVATTDPTGAVWREELDAAGHAVASVDPTGVRVGVDVDVVAGTAEVADADGSAVLRVDPLGRATSIGQPDGSAAIYTYDRCGRPVEALDADGGLTVVERDAAGRVVTVTSPTGAVTRRSYDTCGRLATLTDPLGAVTTIGYDVDSRPVVQTMPTGEQVRTTFDACGRVVAHRAPGAGTLTWEYDLAGRVVVADEPRFGRRTFRYDAAGQLVAVVDGNGGVTTYGYDANGRATTVTDPLGGVTRRAFDAMNRCVAETDPLGRTTRAGYDAAGRLAWQESPDGRRTTWAYDAAGRPASMAVDGRTVTALTRDLRRRTVRVADDTGEGRVEHELEWNGRGLLVRRSRGGRTLRWTYDADGHRTSMSTPDGATTAYGYDAAGRLSWVDHSVLGRAAFDRDAAGRLTSALAGALIQAWDHRDGFVVAHSVTDGDGATRTEVERDEDGRVRRIRTGDGHGSRTADYAYDGASQLVEVRSADGTARSVHRWAYDAAGRLVRESSVVGDETSVVEHVHDAAGQLLATTDHAGHRTTYGYDGSGRRTSVGDERGAARELVWNPSGYLTGVVHHEGDRVRRTRLHTDALGELASVDGTEVFWDSAGFAGAPVLVGETSVLGAGAVTGVGGAGSSAWTAPGWRTARATSSDPWRAAPAAATVADLGPVAIGASGEVSVDGLEWMGARVYDPVSRGFLSVDPLDPVTGAGWAGNPYAFAGNDPLHALDPAGLRPVTDAELQQYRDGNGIGGTFKAVTGAVGGWLKDNWEYVAGGAMVVAGGVLVATGVGGPVGVMLISAGADTIIQKATTGEVNWGQVAISGAAGAVGFGVGGAVAKVAGTGLRGVVAAGAAGGAAEGAVNGGGSYLVGPGPHTVNGFVQSTATGTVVGGVTGGAGGAAAHGISSLADRGASSAVRTLDDVPAVPAKPSPIDPDTARIADHVATAKGDFDAGTIPMSAKEAVNLTNPRVSAATRGTLIDRQAKGYIDNDPDLQHLYTTPAGHYGPDVMDFSGSGRWWDITTAKQWDMHQKKYDHLGPGIGVFTD
ncbi:DUF6531 domain-containing protein [Microlunatus antarcticus]